MSPEQFLARLKKQKPAPAYLFLGQESYFRRVVRQQLTEAVLPDPVSRPDGVVPVELGETTLTAVLDDARSLSLFANERLVWVGGAEAALPRRMAAEAEGDEEDGKAEGPVAALRAYLQSPTPGVVLVFDCNRYDFQGDDRAKLERVEKFYAAIPEVVEFRHLDREAARHLAQDLIAERQLQLGPAELAMLVEAVGGDASRLANEIEKLALYVGSDRRISAQDLAVLVPNAAQSTIFTLVAALGRKDRRAALQAVALLVREGEYLPLALTFLNTQFRLALVAKQANLRSAQQVQTVLGKQGLRIWRDRAEQVAQTAAAFSQPQLSRALELLYLVDSNLRDTRPDDRTVMEQFVFALTV